MFDQMRRPGPQVAPAPGNEAAPEGPVRRPILPVQRKAEMVVGAPDDPLEHEADRVAEEVTSGTSASPALAAGAADPNGGPARRKGGSGESTVAAEDVLPSGAGRPLEAETQADLGGRFGRDFSGVRVHEGAAAAASAQSVDAVAYTVGKDIVFGQGQYAPGSASGQKLLAHELTHVVQQGQAPAAGDAADREEVTGAAEHVATSRVHVARVGGWTSDPKVGAWNKDSTTVSGEQRIPLEGLTEGLADAAASTATNESANQRAIAIVPAGFNASAPADVLLHFHGHNIGYRERSVADSSAGPKGTVRDVEADQIPQQMAASGYQNLIAILPQGTTGSSFNAKGFHADAYVNGALAKLGATLAPPVTIQRGKVILSGHSGGGPRAVAAADELNPASPADANDPFKQDSPLLLFDGINGPTELATLKAMLARWIAGDLAKCTALGLAAAPTRLVNRGLRFRSTYSDTGAYYGLVHLGGSHTAVPKHDPKDPPPPAVVDWTIAKSDALVAWLAAKFADPTTQAAMAAVGVDKILPTQYVTEHVGGSHDRTMATGAGAAPGASDRDATTHIPNYKPGSGNLEHALGDLKFTGSSFVGPLPLPSDLSPQ
jgi:hypothetical protein